MSADVRPFPRLAVANSNWQRRSDNGPELSQKLRFIMGALRRLEPVDPLTVIAVERYVAQRLGDDEWEGA